MLFENKERQVDMAIKPCKCGSDRILGINAKCSDLFIMSYKELEYDGYVPTSLPFGKNGYGDYVEMDICLDCGQIQGWKKVSEEVIQGAFAKG